MVPGIWYNAFTYRKYASYYTTTISDALILHTPSIFLYQREELIQLDVSIPKCHHKGLPLKGHANHALR